MKNLLYISATGILLFIYSCNGSSDAQKKANEISNTLSQQSSDEEKPVADGAYMKATIDGKQWRASKTMTDNEPSSSYKFVYGDSDDFTISFYIYKPETGNKRPFTENYAADFSTSDAFFGGRKGELIITKADDEWVEGTFNFTANSTSSGSSKVYEITNGSFRVKATRGN